MESGKFPLTNSKKKNNKAVPTTQNTIPLAPSVDVVFPFAVSFPLCEKYDFL